MGKDRKVEVLNMIGTKSCPDLFANIILSGEQNKKSNTTIVGLSKKEAIEVFNQLGDLFSDNTLYRFNKFG